jgi:UDP-glucose 4-epimerase
VNNQDLLALDDSAQFVLVVGGLGFIGSHTTLELLKEGYNVIVVDDLSNSYGDVLSRIAKLAQQDCSAKGQKMPYLKFHHCDYRSPEMRYVLKQYDAPVYFSPSTPVSSATSPTRPQSLITSVIHFAAYKAVEESIQSPLSYYQNNVCGLVDFLIQLKHHNITNFVFSSSATVYGEKTNEGRPLREADLVHHPEIHGDECILPGAKGLTSPYGRTKYFCEAILADVAQSDPSWTITALRYFNPVGCHPSGLLGEDPRQKPTNLFPVITSVLTGTKPTLEVFGSDWDTVDGTPVRDFIHVTDLARGHIAACVSKENQKPFRTYNLGTGRGSSVSEAIASFEAASLTKIPVLHAGRRPGDVGSCVAETEKVERELGWKTEKTLDECARDTWNFICKSKEEVVF